MRHNPVIQSVLESAGVSKERDLSEVDVVGRGIYSFSRVAAIAGVSPRSVRQWTLGRRSKPGSVSRRPIVHLDIPELDGECALSFLNLIEVKLISEFRRLGLPLQYIRRVVDVLERSYDTTHPLVCHRLQTDGKSIFAEIDESGEFACVEIAGRRPNHVVLEDVIRPLFKEIDFAGAPELAQRWYPLGRDGGVVIDPARAFGEPVIEPYGVPTRTLASQVTVAGDSAEVVAEWYEMPAELVVLAVDYESGLRTRAA